MIKISRDQEKEMRRQISSWMAERGLPMVLYDKLKPYHKILLHNWVCLGTNSTCMQRLDVYNDLGVGVSEARGAGASSHGDQKPPDEYLKEYFSPPTSTGGIPYQKMF